MEVLSQGSSCYCRGSLDCESKSPKSCLSITADTLEDKGVSGKMSSLHPESFNSFNPESCNSPSQCCTGGYSLMPAISGFVDKQDWRSAKAEIESTIAQSMTQLSSEEREMAQEDLHGVTVATSEDRAQIDAGLEYLDLHLNSIKHGSAYEMAEAMDSDYVRDR
eukprot:scaffold8913_cov116-Cylindrotheca_fusiformis.AAC.1